jgi:hypothetical protein
MQPREDMATPPLVPLWSPKKAIWSFLKPSEEWLSSKFENMSLGLRK